MTPIQHRPRLIIHEGGICVSHCNDNAWIIIIAGDFKNQ